MRESGKSRCIEAWEDILGERGVRQGRARPAETKVSCPDKESFMTRGHKMLMFAVHGGARVKPEWQPLS